MNAAVLVALAAAVLAIVIMGTFLVSIAVALKGFSARLTETISALGAIAEKTEPVGPAVEALERDLAATQQVLAAAMEPEKRAAGEPADEQREATAPPAPAAPDADSESEPEPTPEPESKPEPAPDPTAPAPRSDRLSAVRPQYVRRPRPQ